ncbi:cell cycle checkpoint control protein RAD9A [Condylostylus longicornis]|uniref:cell cycle checkpoint control protein RAD9A n=1 Tax=Condylostylus longicornis TaxID=2530218 RepID=UPI00244E26CA|nr:cell cycle checkpoint control protein RAD9A [Condylostylus longicornis]
MICVLPGNNARIFAKAINTVAKFGDLYFEPEADGLSLKSINYTKSAYITFKFLDSFFSDYEYENLSQNIFDGKCKVSIKTFLGIFKNMKQVDQCKISIDSEAEKLIIEFNCKLDTKKKYIVSILDVEVLQPGSIGNIDKRNRICGSTKIFSDISNNFQMQEDEITMVAESNRLIVKNYIDGQVIDPKFMRSQLKLKGEEFDVYSIKKECSITYCLREFRALLHFAESLNIDISVFFEEAGMPVVFKIANLSVFEATLFMSTLSPDDISMIDEDVNKSNTRNISLKENNVNNKSQNQNENLRKKSLTDTVSLDDENDITDDILMDIDLESTIKNHSQKEQNSARNDTSKNDAARNQKSTRVSNFPPPVTLNISDDDSVTFIDTEIQEDCIPASPPSKKLKKLFRRCFEPTYLPSDSDTVLAVDSDPECF